MATTYPDLTPDQAAAVAEFAARHGRRWKRELRWQWMEATTPGHLQRLRNTHGLLWLATYKLGKAGEIAEAAPSAPPRRARTS